MQETKSPAIVLSQVKKHFRKKARSVEYTTLKSGLVRLFQGKRRLLESTSVIEALKGVDLTVPKGSTIGIIGRNGSGKSTLLKIITGIYGVSSGTVTVNGRISALLELGAGFHPDFSGRENIFINGMILGMTRLELKARVDEIIAFAELGDFIDEPVRTYSSGMFMRLAFAVATHVDPEILIIDEILSVGDEHFQKKSRDKMLEFRSSGRTILLVTHDLNTVASWCDSAVWIDGGVARMVGDPKEVVDEYRKAISAAEIDDVNQVLSQPGVALPVVPRAVEKVGPVQLKALTLEGEASALESRSPVVLAIAYEAARPAAAVFQCQCFTQDDVLLFESSNAFEVTHSGQSQCRFELKRLSLSAGSYRFVVRIESEEGHTDQSLDFQVGAKAEGKGFFEPEHQWTMQTT